MSYTEFIRTQVGDLKSVYISGSMGMARFNVPKHFSLEKFI